MKPREILKDIYYVGAIDWDRKLFDELIPLPIGTTYNSYLIKGSEKTALVDTVDPEKDYELLHALDSLELDNIDYIISNHGEQDHSGSIPFLLDLYPKAKVVTNEKCKEILKSHLTLDDENFIVVGDRDELSLGDKTLEFIIAPWVHWPDTMFTYLKEDKFLMTGDLFGAHMATSDLFVEDEYKTLDYAKRYYAEIMMPFRNHIKKYITWVDEMKPEIVAPSHGPLHRNPEFIIEAYREWVSDDVKRFVLIPYVSMHDSTLEMVEYLVDRLIDYGLSVKPYNLTKTDLGDLAMDAVDASTIIIATSTVLGGPHPTAVSAAYILNALRPKTKLVSVLGSYGWGGRTDKVILDLLSLLKADKIDPLLIKGRLNEENISLIDTFAEAIYKKNLEF